VTRDVRSYDHFCTLARAMERVGDRWTLLVVRDLIGGPRRFTDLMNRLGGITPKTLAQRLRELADDGIVEVDREEGRREVWYRLTDAGEELGPIIDSLTVWGLRHARRPPLPGELVHPEHLLKALRVIFDRGASPSRPVAWQFDFTGDGSYTLAYDGSEWSVHDGATSDTPDVVVQSTRDEWARFVLSPPDQRDVACETLELSGTKREIDRFRELLARFPDGLDDVA
jgi:DNA-binding HxlR family transcriptional regulator